MADNFLVLAPRGRDASIIEGVLRRGDVQCVISDDVAALCGRLAEDAGGLVVTEEALVGPHLDPVLAWFDRQPPWSDIPVVVLAARQSGRRSALATNLIERLGNVVILERPINAETLLSAVRSALRVRRRQYQARAHLQERAENERLLQSLNETLEARVQERTRDANRARETLAFALDSAGMGSWDLDLSTGDARRTLRHDEVFGYAELLPHWDRDLFLQHVVTEDRNQAQAAFAIAMSTGTFDLECRIRRVDETQRWIAARGRVAYSEAGEPERMAGIVMDISERRFAEEALRQSQKMQAIGQLTGGLAHDFNNLLAGITGSLELMQTRIAQGRADEAERYIIAAQGAATRAAALTHRLLAFSRRQTLDPKPTNVNRLVAGMEELIGRTAGPAIRLETVFAADLWPTLCDPNQLENALLNFCINARDAMPDGGVLMLQTENVTLEEAVAHEQQLRTGSYVALNVSDTGGGMPPDVLARAFDPFFTTKPIGTGTGLGLSMAYGFAQQSGGQIRIASELGRGTTVRLLLPRHEHDEMLPAAEAGPLISPGAQAGEAVLVVDDEPTVRMLVAEVLTDLGYSTLEASDSTSALAIVQAGARLDLLVTDVGLPGLNGRQLADAVRSLRPGLRVLFITGYVENAAIGHAHLEPGMHVLTKPFAIDALARKIRTIIGGA